MVNHNVSQTVETMRFIYYLNMNVLLLFGLTFVFCCCCCFRSHCSTYEHPMLPIKGLIDKRNTWEEEGSFDGAAYLSPIFTEGKLTWCFPYFKSG